MQLKRLLVQRKYFILSTILSFISGVVIGYSLLGFPIVSSLVAWIGTSVTFTLVINMLYWTYKEIHQLETEPSFKLENPKVDTHNGGTNSEFKDVLFDIRNKGGGEAQDCRVDIKVDGIWNDFETLKLDFPNEVTFSINPKDKKTIKLCQVTRKPDVVQISTLPQKYPLLGKGKIYELKLQIKGKNITEEKIHKLKLDLSSWENIGITLDC